MTYRVKIYGAGSIGNHLAHACRNEGWQVSICDVDPAALARTREEIYPGRYGKWDEEIMLASPDELDSLEFDLVIIGTPPDSHIALALTEVNRESRAPKAILIEKPLCGLDLAGCDELKSQADDKGITVCVGYNHVLTRNTTDAGEMLRKHDIGTPGTIAVEWVEHWGGIFAAHPWLAGPSDSYLGHAARGGGACGEHSHGINIWQHFSHLTGQGRIVEVTAVMDHVKENGVDYDRVAQLSLVTETGMTGFLVQDVITQPPLKRLRIQGEQGALNWEVNNRPGHDSVGIWTAENGWLQQEFEKTRPDDFAGEIAHLGRLLGEEQTANPISLERGLETMMVISAAHKSAVERRPVEIDYSSGFNNAAIQ